MKKETKQPYLCPFSECWHFCVCHAAADKNAEKDLLFTEKPGCFHEPEHKKK